MFKQLRTLFFMMIISTIYTQLVNDQKEFQNFLTFMRTYGKNYKSIKELTDRFEVFKENLVKENLTDMNSGISTGDDFVKGVTQFTDLTEEEFASQYLTLNESSDKNDLPVFDSITAKDDTTFLTPISAEAIADQVNNKLNETSGRSLQTITIPSSFDWRTKGAVTGVKNQGACGSCWAFATVANIESQYFIKYKKLQKFSEEQLLDCDPINHGCNGGNFNYAVSYVKNAGGLMLQSAYPYIGRKSVCLFRSTLAAVKVKGSVSPGTTDENKIKAMLYKLGPLAASMNASSLQFYTSGIINMSTYACNPNNLNHAVTLVGYGVSTTGLSYWIAKNSWGAYWGESGYFRIRMGAGVCGINRFVSSAVIQ